MKKSYGFTVIELVLVVVLFLAMSGLFLYQKNSIQSAARDDRRKADINTLYYNIEKVYYPQHQSYPTTLDTKSLPGLQPDIFKDPDGITINESRTGDLQLIDAQSTYRYEPTGCKDSTCTGYTLRATLENEADYIKKADHAPAKK